MPYLGKSPTQGVRQRYQYTATAGQTTFSGTDSDNLTLTYTDANFVDVYQNGVLLKGGGTDYTATTGTSVVLATGASVSDVIEIIVYDVFAVANHVKKSGDNMTGDLTFIQDTSSDTLPVIKLQSNDADADSGPVMHFLRNSASPADNDELGKISFKGKNSADEEIAYAFIDARSSDVTDGTEDGQFRIITVTSGTFKSRFTASETETVINEASLDLDFRVESDDNTHALFVDAGNNHVNIGTSTDHGGVLNVQSTDNTDTLVLACTDGDELVGPILKLDRGSSSPANSDLAGKIAFTSRNAADESVEICNLETRITDITDGAEDSRLIVRTIKNGTETNRIDMQDDETVFNEGAHDVNFRVESQGETNMILVDASENSVRLGSHTAPDSTNTRVVINGNASFRACDFDRPTSTASHDLVRFYSNVGGTNTNIATIEVNGDFMSATNSYGSLSDERFKQDIVDSGSQWDDVKAMRIRKYRRKNMVATEGDNAPVEIGVIAQELEASSMGGLVKTNPKDDENKEEFKTVKYTVLYMKAVKALQEAMARIETLEAKVTALESK